jgi:hypothetical protein
VIELVKRLSKAVSRHINAREVIEGNVTSLVLLLSTLIVAILADYIKSGLVVSVELNRHKVITLVANLGK